MNDLMTLDDLAQMNHCSVRHARDVLVKLPGFPVLRPLNGRPRWDRQEVLNFINRKPLDAPGEHCLYRHYDVAGNLLYIGISLSAIHRLSEHRRRSRWADQIARVEIQRFPTRAAVEEAERQAIKTEKPIYNVQHAVGVQ